MAPVESAPKKRKTRPSDTAAHPDAYETRLDELASSNLIPPKGEYETGRVICEACGEGVSFRDEATGGFTLQHWEAHRTECPNSAQQDPGSVPQDQEIHFDSTHPLAKRRRAKRSEEERIEYLRSDPYVAKFEPYRVLCACCDKWIRLRPNSTYCSIPWDAHRKSCLAKRLAKNAYPTDDRSAIFAADPTVRKFDSERVLCKMCETWVSLGKVDGAQAIRTWIVHRDACKPTVGTATSEGTSTPSIPTADSVPPSKHLSALASATSLSVPSLAQPSVDRASSHASSHAQSASLSSFKDYTVNTFTSNQEPRRRNAEQRAALLRADPLAANVEPNRVFCTMCHKWVQLRQDSSYCAYPWQQHRTKCLARQERRSQRDAERRAHQASALEADVAMSNDDDESDEPESEEGVESGDEEEKVRRREERREERRKARAAAKADTLASRIRQEEARMAMLHAGHQNGHSSVSDVSEGDEDAVGDDDMDVVMDVGPPRLADLDSPLGRLEFAFRSVRYLFKSTYEGGDDLTIAALVTYLNAAMPPDKHEDFDTAEVTKAATALHEKGHFVFEGDVLRMAC